jgi:hypothetical protein
MVAFTEQEIQEIINVLAEAPAKYTMGVIIKLADRAKTAREEEIKKQMKKDE